MEYGEYSSMILLLVDKVPICSGTIIEREVVIAPAHCVYSIVIGRYHMSSLTVEVALQSSLQDQKQTVRRVKSIVVHEWFVENRFGHDISAILLESPFDEDVVPARLYLGRLPPNSWCAVVYWSEMSGLIIDRDSIKQKQLLLKLGVTLTDSEQCAKSYGNVIQDGAMFCAVENSENIECFGNYGGSLFCDNKLSGMLTFKTACGSEFYPAVYVNVTKYHRWISSDGVFKNESTTAKISADLLIFVVVALMFGW